VAKEQEAAQAIAASMNEGMRFPIVIIVIKNTKINIDTIPLS
jgi:hypothetical protein